MSLLDSFLLEFSNEGLPELNDDVIKADDNLDKFGQQAKKTEKQIKDLGKAIEADGARRFKALAIQTVKAVAPMVLLGKAIHQTMQFASDVSEVVDAAKEAGMTLEQFQAQDGNRYQIYNREDVNNAKEYEQVMRDIRMGGAAISANLSRALLPALIAVGKIVRNIIDFFVDHSTLIRILGALAGITGGIWGIAKVIQFGANPVIKQMGIALWSALAPILPIIIGVTALIAGLVLIIEDLIVWVNGGESAFGDLWSEIFGGVEGAKQLFDDFISVFKELWAIAQPILQGIGDLILKGIYFILKATVTVLAAVVKGIKALTGKSVDVDVNQNVKGSHAGGLDYVPYDGYIAELHKGERVQTADEANDWRSGLMAAKKAINFTASYPLNAIPSGAVSNAYNNSSSNRTINIGDITIQTQATDAQGIATDIASYIKQAVISLDDGMLA